MFDRDGLLGRNTRMPITACLRRIVARAFRLFALRIANGMFAKDSPDAYRAVLDTSVRQNRIDQMSDGRTILVSRDYLPVEGEWVAIHQDVTDQVSANERIEYLATHDALTGLAIAPIHGATRR